MKASEFIEKLTSLVKEHGDKEILFEYPGFNYEDLCMVNDIHLFDMYVSEEEIPDYIDVEELDFKYNQDNKMFIVNTDILFHLG